MEVEKAATPAAITLFRIRALPLIAFIRFSFIKRGFRVEMRIHFIITIQIDENIVLVGCWVAWFLRKVNVIQLYVL